MGPGLALLCECGCLCCVSQWPSGLLWFPVVSSTLGPEWFLLFVLMNGYTRYSGKALVKGHEPTDPTLGSGAGLSFLICKWEQ